MRPLFLVALLVSAVPAASEPAGDRKGELRKAQMEYLRGMLLERRGSAAEALAAYEKALEHDPDSVFIAQEAAELALENGNLARALSWARRVVELDPETADSHALLGRVQSAAGDAEGAEKSFEAALKLDPHSAESVYSLGELIVARSPERARALLRRFLKDHPEEAAEAHYQLGRLELQSGRPKVAIDNFKQSIKLSADSESTVVRYSLGQAYETIRDTEAALAVYQELARFEPQNAALLNHIGQLLTAKGDWDGARDRFLAVKALQKDEPTANHWLALDAERREAFAEAAGYVRDNSALADDPGLHLRLSYYLSQSGQLEEAVKTLERAYQLWPRNDQVAYFLALGYDDLKRPVDAIRLLRAVLELKPDYREARYQLAVLLEKGGRLAEAEPEFRALIAARPDDAQILNYLGYSLADRGLKLDEAEALVRRAVQLDPQSGAYLDSLGWVAYKQGRSTEAVADLLGALSKLPDDETVCQHLGDAYAALGEESAAWLQWKRADSLRDGAPERAREARRLERRWGAEQLGEAFAGFLALSQGGLKRVTGLADISGKVLGRGFSFSGLFTFREPDQVDLDVLGPLFTPIVRARLGADGFSSDPIRLDGVSPEAAAETLQGLLTLMRDYLSGSIFAARPVIHRKRFWKRRLVAGDWRVGLGKDALSAESFEREGQGYRLRVSEFGRVRGRLVPRTLAIEGRGFELRVRFEDVKVDVFPASRP